MCSSYYFTKICYSVFFHTYDYDYKVEIIRGKSLEEAITQGADALIPYEFDPNFDYLDKLLTDWHERNLKTVAEVEAFLSEMKQKKQIYLVV